MKQEFDKRIFNQFFLREFTKELIRNYYYLYIKRLGIKEGEIKERRKGEKEEKRKESIKEKVKEEIEKEEKRKESIKEKGPLSLKKEDIEELRKPIKKRSLRERRRISLRPRIRRSIFPRRVSHARLLQIPEPTLPPQFQYLTPTPGPEEIDLGRLNPLLKDPLVKIIECPGPGEHIFVYGPMGRKPTEIILNKEEIDNIINKFSRASKIPVIKGVYKVIVGKFILSAVISDIIGSKFIIKKMITPATVPFQQRFQPRVS